MKYHPTSGGQYEWPIGPTLKRRFLVNVQKGETFQCWPWQAGTNPAGYGTIRNGNVMALAHRVAWVLVHGEITGLKRQVLHTCDNPPCCNPGHLYLGDNLDNVRDKVERGRSHFPHPERRGSGHPLAKLTEAQVQEIRGRSTGRRGEGRALAAEFGVSPATVCNVLKRKVWQHI